MMNDKTNEMAVVYARYSSHSQGEQSIEGQLAAAKIYAENHGYTIIHEYIDRAMTGRNDDRDEFQQMLKDCTKKQFTVIITWKVDRIGRNREEIALNKYHCKKYGARVEYVAENLPDSPEAVILESVLEGMAEYYSLQLSQNIKRGYLESAKKCKYAGGRVPLGYQLNAEKKFVINPDTAPIVRTIFAKYVAGYTITEINDELNSQGIKTGSGTEFNKNSLRTILKNEKYIGIYDFKHGQIRIEGGVPAIVDRDVFVKVQELLKSNQAAPAHKFTKAEYLLTEKLFCGMCGSPMVGESGISHTGAKHGYYICIKKKREHSCTKKAVRQDTIESCVLEAAKDILYDDEVIEYIINGVWSIYESQDETKDRIAVIKKQIADIDVSLNNILKAIEAGIFNDTTKNRMDDLSEQKTLLAATLAQYELSSGPVLTKDHIRFYFQTLRETDLQDRDCQKRLIKTFINSVYVFDDHLDVNFNFSGDNSTVSFDVVTEMEQDTGFVCRASVSTKTRGYELFFREKTFTLIKKLPRR